VSKTGNSRSSIPLLTSPCPPWPFMRPGPCPGGPRPAPALSRPLGWHTATAFGNPGGVAMTPDQEGRTGRSLATTSSCSF
jgi:hypothetical protein